MDAGLKRALEAKISAGERLSREDGVALCESDDLAWLGRLAHHRRTEISGDRVTFAVNRHLNLASACPDNCAYCSFYRKPGNEDDRAWSVDDIVSKATATGEQLTELRIVNAVHSGLAWGHYPQMLRALRAALPAAGLLCFTATDMVRLEEISGRPAGDLLDELMAAGLDSLTGGDAQIFDPGVRPRTDADACGWEDWSRVHRLAHERGMKTPATMLYGHLEEPRHRIDHIMRLRDLQDETGGFAVFAPLRYQHDPHEAAGGDAGARRSERTPMAAPAESLKTFAVSRLMFDNVPHVKALSAPHGMSVAQLSLNFGADDLDGSGAPAPVGRDDLLDLIWDAGFRPVERNARYEVVREYDPAPSLAERRSEPQRVWA